MASSGISQDLPAVFAPGILPAEQKSRTRRGVTPHPSATSLTVLYPSVSMSSGSIPSFRSEGKPENDFFRQTSEVVAKPPRLRTGQTRPSRKGQSATSTPASTFPIDGAILALQNTNVKCDGFRGRSGRARWGGRRAARRRAHRPSPRRRSSTVPRNSAACRARRPPS